MPDVDSSFACGVLFVCKHTTEPQALAQSLMIVCKKNGVQRECSKMVLILDMLRRTYMWQDEKNDAGCLFRCLVDGVYLVHPPNSAMGSKLLYH